MAWSTRQLAELAGTSLRTVRHYHEVGLLAEPERRANGYKRYGVAHLVRLLRIKRLTDLGFSLAQIAGMGAADEHPGEAFRTLDADLASTIERLKRVRAELALILREAAPTDLPPDLAPAASDPRLSDADRSFMVVMSRVLSPSAITAYKDMLEGYDAEPPLIEFDHLPADADQQTRIDLARRMVPHVRELHTRHPRVQEMKGNARSAAQAVQAALVDLYNPAQVEVLARVGQLIETSAEPG